MSKVISQIMCKNLFSIVTTNLFIRDCSNKTDLFVDIFLCAFSFTAAPSSRHPSVQTNARSTGGRGARGSAKPVCKVEPEMENQTGE